MSQGEGEYEIGEILNHVEFDKLVQRALAGKAVFHPQSISKGRSQHSKYAYLVHWKNYELRDRTWEPETTLKRTVQLAAYKSLAEMPREHEKIEKEYGNVVWRNLSLHTENSVGTRYLMTQKEKDEDKKNMLKQQDERIKKEEARRMEKRREKMTTPDDPEKLFKKRKKETSHAGSEDETSKAPGFKIPKKRRSSSLDRKEPSSSSNITRKRDSDEKKSEFRKPRPVESSSSSSLSTSNKRDKERTGPARPGLKSLNVHTPRIQKKALPTYIPATPGYNDDLYDAPRVRATATPEPMPDVTLEPSSSSSSREERTIRKEPDGAFRSIPKTGISVERSISSSTMSTCSTSQDEEMDDVENEKARKEHEKQVEKARREVEKLTTKLKDFPVKVKTTRIATSYSTHLNLKKFRRCQSSECLNDRWNCQADLELFGKNFEFSSRIQQGVPQAVTKVFPPDEPFLGEKKKRSSTLEEEDQLYENLVKENLAKLAKIKHPFKRNLRKILPHLVTAYSKDDNIRFKEIFLKNIPKKPRFDAHRYAIVVFMISYFKHINWDADPKGNAIVEANESKICGMIREHNPMCSENHRKCTWLRMFMELVPSKVRFEESSGKNFNGREGEDGPFRDDVYFHCMKLGAECQKRLFFEFDKPIGLQEDDVDDFYADGMHLLAVQYGNLQRIASYLSLGGADINALATHRPTNRVYRLHDYLKFWIDKNVTTSNNEHMDYYNNLLGMVRHTSESLETFVKGIFNVLIANRMGMMWKIYKDLTFPHIIRCSPINNEENGGDGSHQVLTCLFSPTGVGFRDGISANEEENDDKDVKKLRGVLEKYQKLASKKHGRLVVALYRVEIEYAANVKDGYMVPIFKHITSNDGFVVDQVNILRQTENLPSDIVHIELVEHKYLTSPGALYYVIQSEEKEKNLIVPGNAHIEIIGKFDQPMCFVAQVFYIKGNYS